MSWKFPKMLNENLIIDFLRTMCDCQGHPKDHSISLSSQNNLFYEISNDFHFTSSNKFFFLIKILIFLGTCSYIYCINRTLSCILFIHCAVFYYNLNDVLCFFDDFLLFPTLFLCFFQ